MRGVLDGYGACFAAKNGRDECPGGSCRPKIRFRLAVLASEAGYSPIPRPCSVLLRAAR
jgi:hypothetical protein